MSSAATFQDRNRALFITVARRLSVSGATVRRLFDRGRLRSIQVVVRDVPHYADPVAPVIPVLILAQLSCTPTPARDRLPGVDLVKGVDPVWVATADKWHDGGGRPAAIGQAKTLWIFRTTRQSVRVEGRELHSGARPRFQHSGLDAPVTETMTISDPWRESVVPGGQRWDLKNEYLFIPSYVFYPSPGCYEFVVEREGSHHRIVVEMK